MERETSYTTSFENGKNRIFAGLILKVTGTAKDVVHRRLLWVMFAAALPLQQDPYILSSSSALDFFSEITPLSKVLTTKH